jgi:hypothetical protein
VFADVYPVRIDFARGEKNMKTFTRVAAYILLGMFIMLATVSLRAQQTDQQVADMIQREANHPSKEIVQQPVMTRYQLHSEDHTAEVLAIDSLWSNYTFYNDTHNGPGIASIFTEDAVLHFAFNDHGKLVPTGNTNGCRLIGRKDFATFFGYNRTANLGPENHNGLALPGPSRHIMTSPMVKVNDDGKTAMLTAYFQGGVYRTFDRKAPDGWQIAEFYIVFDKVPAYTNQCDMNGPIPRPQN